MSCVPSAAICRVRGDTFPFDVLFKTAAGVAIDLAGTTAKLTVDPSPDPVDGTTKLFELTGVITGPSTDGRWRFTMTTGNANQPAGTYYFDLQWTSGAAIRTVLVGTFDFEQDITK